MGLGARKEILDWLHEICPEAFLKALPFLSTWVCIEDFLTRAPRLYGPRRDGTFTGSECFDEFVKPALKNFQSNCVAQAYCCDDFHRVPLRKRQEQERRDQQRVPRNTATQRVAKRLKASDCPAEENKTPAMKIIYSPLCRIVDGGVEMPNGQVERFNLFALTRTRSLRPALMSYFGVRLSRLNDIPPGRRILLEFDQNGALEYYGRSGDMPRNRVLSDYRHPFGEADLSCVFWLATYCRHHDIIYNSIDSDALPIVNNAIDILQPTKRVIWNDGMSAILDMTAVNRTFRRMGITPKHFAAICAACGCDWVQAAPLWPRLPGGNFTRVRKGMSSYGLLGPNDEVMDLPLPLGPDEECFWARMLDQLWKSQQSKELEEVLFECIPSGGVCRIITLGYLGTGFKEWNGADETDFDERIINLISRLMGSRFLKVDRSAMLHEIQSLSWAVQYFCVPWHRMRLHPPPNG